MGGIVDKILGFPEGIADLVRNLFSDRANSENIINSVNKPVNKGKRATSNDIVTFAKSSWGYMQESHIGSSVSLDYINFTSLRRAASNKLSAPEIIEDLWSPHVSIEAAWRADKKKMNKLERGLKDLLALQKKISDM